METLKKQQIGARVSGDLYQKFTAEMSEKTLTQTQLFETILREHFDGSAPAEPQIVEKIVEVPRQLGDWEIDLLQCNSETLGAFLEIADTEGKNKNEILNTFVNFIAAKTGNVKQKYIQLANDLKNGGK